jgi:hypothetical protein
LDFGDYETGPANIILIVENTKISTLALDRQVALGDNKSSWRYFSTIYHKFGIAMPYTLKYDPEMECVVATFEGQVDSRMAEEFTLEMARVFEENDCKCLLADMRHGLLAMSILELDDLPLLGPAIGIGEGCSAAIVVNGDSEKFSFLQATCNIRQQNVRVFTDCEEAREWLLTRKQDSRPELSV